jgi:hypothetical protein
VGDNLLIAGTTTYDRNDAALEEILEEWDRTDVEFNQGLSDLIDVGASSDNGSYDLTSSSVMSNDQSKTITSKVVDLRQALGPRHQPQAVGFRGVLELIVGRAGACNNATRPLSGRSGDHRTR